MFSYIVISPIFNFPVINPLKLYKITIFYFTIFYHILPYFILPRLLAIPEHSWTQWTGPDRLRWAQGPKMLPTTHFPPNSARKLTATRFQKMS